MRKLIVVSFLLFVLLLVACSWQKAANPNLPQHDDRLLLVSERREFLLGEPVVLDLSFRNSSQETIKLSEIFVESSYYEAPLWSSFANEPFRECRPNSTVVARERRTLTMSPNEKLRYKYRVVYRWWPKPELVFPKAGEYRVYAVYPLYVAGGPPVSVPIASKVVQVSIKEPVGEDAKVWQKLNDPLLLTLLQVETIDQKQKNVPAKMAELLRGHPTSRYAPSMRHALSKVYFRRNETGLPQKDQTTLAATLGITRVETLVDDRLGARRKDQLAAGTSLTKKETPLGKILALMTEVGVPFDASPELKAMKANIGVGYTELRQAMRSLSDEFEGSWERRGEGYLLVPFRAENIPAPTPK